MATGCIIITIRSERLNAYHHTHIHLPIVSVYTSLRTKKPSHLPFPSTSHSPSLFHFHFPDPTRTWPHPPSPPISQPPRPAPAPAPDTQDLHLPFSALSSPLFSSPSSCSHATMSRYPSRDITQRIAFRVLDFVLVFGLCLDLDWGLDLDLKLNLSCESTWIGRIEGV